MRRLLLVLALLLGLIAVQPASAAPSIGISDLDAATFVDPLFPKLKMRMARFVTPWDVMDPGNVAQRNKLINWTDHARRAGQRMLVAFEASRTEGRQFKAPSVARYTRAIRAFRAAYPDVRDIQPWNEANRCQQRNEFGFVTGQPICRNPRRAAQYYMAALKVFKGRSYKVTGLDILDAAKVDCRQVYCALRYIKEFLRHAKPHPRYWGLHNYGDTNRFDTRRTRAILKATRRGDVWLTETGGIVSLGKNFPYDVKRAAKALGCMFTLARSSPRITRLYVYHFKGLKRGRLFDAGLLNPNGTKRPGFDVVVKRRARPCRR